MEVSGGHTHDDEPEHRHVPWLALVTRTPSCDPILEISLSSLPRVWERAGGWHTDGWTDGWTEDEVSFCLRALRRKRADEYLASGLRPTILCNRDLRGLDKRSHSAGVYLRRHLQLVDRTLGRHHPAPAVPLHPLYLLVSYGLALGSPHRSSRRSSSIPGQVHAAIALLVTLPLHTLAALVQLLPRRADRRAVNASPGDGVRRPGGADAGASRC